MFTEDELFYFWVIERLAWINAKEMDEYYMGLNGSVCDSEGDGFSSWMNRTKGV